MRTLIIIIQIFGGLTLIPWFAIAGISFMAFDSPQSIKKLAPWLFIIAVFSYPFILGASYWWAWSNFISSHTKSAIFWSFLPIFIFIVAYFFITQFTNFLKNQSK